MGKVAIHGFGRIGRSITKVALKNNLFTPVSISDIRDIPTFAALFEVDSNYGRWHEAVDANIKAVAADHRYRAVAGAPQGFLNVYSAHNRHMLTYAAMMTGQSKLANEHIRAMVDAIRALDTDAGLRSRLSELGPRQASLFSPERYQVRVRDAYAKLGVRLGD